jgi:dienelactone hydrolase
MKLLVPFCASLVLIGCGSAPEPPKSPGAQEVSFDAASGKKVYADLYAAPKKATAVVLMFHQAHSSAAEYYVIAPMVNRLGFDGLAVDQRSGGDMYGKNRTADQYSGSPSYMDAYADIEAALKWAESQGYKKIIAWGSSYSASFMFRLASEHKDIAAVIAFSPGEYFDQDKGIVAKWASGVSVPVMAVCQESEKPDVTAILNSKPAGAAPRTLYCDDKAIHGSSTLRVDKNPQGAGEYRKDVEEFLRAFAPAGAKKPAKSGKAKR